MYNNVMRVILASASPRRQELLKQVFSEFDIAVSNANEDFVEATPYDNVMTTAFNKASAIAREYDDLVIGMDTTVFMDNKYYNKPVTQEDARRMLKELSGRVHTVYTGICILYHDKRYSFYDKSDVVLNDLSDEFIEEYILSGSPMDKAGAYGIQDNGIVKSYIGDYTTIMGLPINKLKAELKEIIGYGD